MLLNTVTVAALFPPSCTERVATLPGFVPAAVAVAAAGSRDGAVTADSCGFKVEAGGISVQVKDKVNKG